MKKGKYLITGCAGFIGSHLTKTIFKDHDLILVDDLSEGKLKNLPFNLRKKIIKKKIQNLKNIKSLNLKGIFHLAAQSSVPLSVTDFYNSSSNNITSSIKVFELAKKFNVPVIYASSSAIYGDLPMGNDNKKKFSITSPYAQDKLVLEDYAKMSYDVFGVSCSMASASAAGDTGTLGSAIDTQGKIDNLLNLESNGVLSWDFTQTQVDIAPIVLIGSGGGAFGAVASDDSGAAGVVNSGHLNNGAGSVWLYRKHPVALPGNSTFSILLRFGSRADLPATGDDGFAVRVTLLGYYKNVIEIG